MKMTMRPSITAGLMAVLMLVAAGLAIVLKPTRHLADQQAPVELEKIVPKTFGDWRVDPTVVPIKASPDVQANLDRLYNQVMDRSYVNSKGQRVMLSIAYGGDQGGDGTQVHRPEFCYTAQGFRLTMNVVGDLLTQYGTLPVRRLVAVQGRRNEPITYWITVGDKATLPGVRRKLAQVAYGLTGKVPDGMLVRVSSIDQDEKNAHRLQDDFINEMLSVMNPQDRVRVAGTFGA
jgi:EpsI family protein